MAWILRETPIMIHTQIEVLTVGGEDFVWFVAYAMSGHSKAVGALHMPHFLKEKALVLKPEGREGKSVHPGF